MKSSFNRFRDVAIDAIVYSLALAIIAISLAIAFAYGVVPGLVFFALCCASIAVIFAAMIHSASLLDDDKEANNG